MKRTIALVTGALLALPAIAAAHEHQIFEINGIRYEFGIGSANEPVFVDDKSGVQLQVAKAGVVEGHEEHHDHDAVEGAVEGLETTLKVELISGDTRKTMDLAPVWSAPGAYNAVFFPTQAVELSYRIFGTIDQVPVDITFTCKQEHDMEGATTDTSRQELSPGVVRIEKRGAFGCPKEKTEYGFPETTSSLVDMDEAGARAISLGSGALALAALAVAWRRRV